MSVYNYTATIATLASIYTFPMMLQTQEMLYQIDTFDRNYNQMYYSDVPSTPSSTGPFAGSGNNVLYCWGFYILKDHVIELTTPDAKNLDLWHTVQILDAYDDTITNLPGLDKNKKSKKYILVGPEEDTTNLIVSQDYKIIRCRTNMIWIVGRVGIKNYDLTTTLNVLHQITAVDLNPNNDFPNFSSFTNAIYSSMSYYTLAADLLEYNKYHINDTGIVSTFNSIGFKSPFIIPPTGSPSLHGYMTGLTAVTNVILPFAFQFSTGLLTANGWSAGTGLGDFKNDYLRHAYAIRAGLAPNIPNEQFYASTFRDSNGAIINGALNNYTMHFEPEELPEVDPVGFWDIAPFDQNFRLIENDIQRYSFCSCNNDLAYNLDGSLDIYFRYTLSDDHTNELPINNGMTIFIFRYYSPTNKTIYEFYLPPITVLSD